MEEQWAKFQAASCPLNRKFEFGSIMKGFMCCGKQLKSNLAENTNSLTRKWDHQIRVSEIDQSGNSRWIMELTGNTCVR